MRNRYAALRWFVGLALALVSSDALAFGSLAIQPSYFVRDRRVGGMVGLYVAEPLGGSWTYDSWSGLGVDFDGVSWNSTNHNLVYNFSRVSLAVGAGASFGREFDYFNPNVHARVQVKLWK
jgi:hypothetical protein